MGDIKEKWKWTNERFGSLGWADTVAGWMGILNPFANVGHGIVFVNDKNGGVGKVSGFIGTFKYFELYSVVNSTSFNKYAKEYSTEFRKEIHLCWVYNRQASPKVGYSTGWYAQS